ncbi:MAG: HAMP domain-containing histidine kinase [Ruminococcus sp.]|nr:HAMP domain-containing histidine kinase [Ruminococcus sp.]
MKRLSIKVRITLWYTFVAAVIIISIFSLLMIYTNRTIRKASERILREATLHAALLLDNDPDLTNISAIEDIQDMEEVDIVIYDDEGNCLYGHNPYIDSETSLSDRVMQTVKADGKSLMIYDVKCNTDSGDMWIRGIDSYCSAEIAGHSMLKIGMLIIPAALILAALGGYFITRKAFAPMKSMTENVDRIITANDLDKRVSSPDMKDDELGHLAATFDEMLSRLQTAFSTEKRFTSDASHELRNPVAAIIAQCEYLQTVTTNSEQGEAVDNIYNSAKRMSELISSLLMLTRADSKRLNMTFEKFDLGELAELISEEFEQQMSDKNITLDLNIKQGVIVNADQTLIMQMLINLFSNAVKYSFDGGKITVSVYESELTDAAVFSISDNGIGIKKENFDNIWSRFYRGDDVRKKGIDGYGLGLSVAKWIAHAHDGIIEVSSSEGEGTTFTVKLPV